jgi:multimeric flavodoxin WrbA
MLCYNKIKNFRKQTLQINKKELNNMKILIISGTPKTEGLSCSCVAAVLEGVQDSGASVEVIRLSDGKLSNCAMCEDGWGDCYDKHICRFGNDGFSTIQKKIAEADAVAIVTPVYWGDMTEAMKCFFDRFRRCEAIKGDEGALAGKPVLLVVSPGGSGNGMISCLEQMERLSHHLHAKIFDFIGVNRWNREYKLIAIKAGAKAMVSSLK